MEITYCPNCKKPLEQHPHLEDIFNCATEEGCKGCFHLLVWDSKNVHWSFRKPYTDSK